VELKALEDAKKPKAEVAPEAPSLEPDPLRQKALKPTEKVL